MGEAIQSVTILYRNHRGEVSLRTITPVAVRFAASRWHPEPQWVLTAVDREKGERDFAVKDILAWLPPCNALLGPCPLCQGQLILGEGGWFCEACGRAV